MSVSSYILWFRYWYLNLTVRKAADFSRLLSILGKQI